MANPKKPATRGAKGNRRRTVLRRGGIGLLALALAGGGTWLGLQAAAAQKAADRYTTGTATTGSVTQTLSASGTVAKVNQASVSFPASGTVTSVKVSVGDSVTAGQELATIDTTALTAAVIQAKADLASAQQDLADAEDAASASASASASSASSTTSGTSSQQSGTTNTSRNRSSGQTAGQSSGQSSARPSSSPTSGSSTGSSGKSGGAQSRLAALLRTVQQAQAELAKREATAAAALAAQSAACAPLTGTTPTPTPSTSSSTTPSTSPSSSEAPSTSATPSASETPSASATSETPSASATSETPSASALTAAATTPADSSMSASIVPIDDPTGDALQKCIDALTASQHAQQAVTQQQLVVSTALGDLSKALQQSAGGSGSGGSGTGSGSGTGHGSGSGGNGSGSGGNGSGSGGNSSGSGGNSSGSGNSGSGQTNSGQTNSGQTNSGQTGSGSGSGGSSTTRSSTSGGGQGGSTLTVGTAQAAVTKDQLALDTAEDNLDAATLRSPLTGVVAELPFTKGATASTSDQATVIAKGSTQVALQVSEATFRQLKVGQHAAITQAGQAPVAGTVSAKALLPTSSSSSGTSTFGVTVTAPAGTSTKLTAGATASVVVTIASVEKATLVPVSAVTRQTTTSGTVSVLANGVVTTTPVTLGVVGDTAAQITNGLQPGAVVVLADRTEAVPTNSTNSIRQLAGAGGGFGGGARPGGAAPGGAAPRGGTAPR